MRKNLNKYVGEEVKSKISEIRSNNTYVRSIPHTSYLKQPFTSYFKKGSYLMKFLLILLLNTSYFIPHTYGQTYPVTANVQIVPPISPAIADFAVPGSDKLRVILLQNDLTMPSYDVRLQMVIELNGSVIMRTSPAFNPRPITLSPGVPTIIGGNDLFDYLQTNNIEFSGGYSRETYERTKTLAEGAYKISFTAFDYRRREVQVSNIGSNIFFLQKKNPPILNMPVCKSRVEKRDPQFITFNWSSINMPSFMPGSETEYVFSLYEIKPWNSNPDYIIRSTNPIYTLTTASNTVIYGPGEPQLIDSMEYVWIVQARDRDGRDMYSNQGYSQSCTFTYTGFNPFAVLQINKPQLYAEAKNERTAKLWWPLAEQNSKYNVETYRLEYRATTKDGVEFPWHTEEKQTDTSITLYSLEPGRTYEARMQWRVAGVYGPYSEVVPFTTPPQRVFNCEDKYASKLPGNSQPLPSAVAGMTVKIGDFDVMLLQVSGGNGTFSGRGRVVTTGFGMGLLMEFTNITINTDLEVIRGDMTAVTEGIDKWVDNAVKYQRGGTNTGQVKTGDIVPEITTKLHIFGKEDIKVDTLAGTITMKDGQSGKEEVIKYKEKNITLPLTIEDADGNLYNVNGQGEVTKIEKDKAGSKSNSQNNSDIKYPYNKYVFSIIDYVNKKIILPSQELTSEEREEYVKYLNNAINWDAHFDLLENAEEVIFNDHLKVWVNTIKKEAPDSSYKVFRRYKGDSVQVLMNGQLVSSEITPNVDSSWLADGLSTLSVKFKPLDKPDFTDLGQIKIRFKSKGSDDYYFAVKKNKQKEIKKKNDELVGDRAEGEEELEEGKDELTISLKEVGTDKVIDSVKWVLKNDSLNATSGSIYTLKPKPGDYISVYFKDVRMNLRLNVKGIEKDRKSNFNNVNVDNLRNNMQIKRRELFGRAANTIEADDNSLYSFVTSVPTQVYVVYKSYPVMDKAIKQAKGQLLGFADAHADYRFNSLLDLIDIQREGNVIKSAELVAKLSIEEKMQIDIAVKKKEMTDQVNTLCKQIKVYNAAVADSLKQKIEAGINDTAFFSRIRYLITEENVNKFYQFKLDGKTQETTMNIYINEDEVGSIESTFTGTLAHEIGHLDVAYNAKVQKLTWTIIKDLKETYKYELADGLGTNGHCSAGSGHEMHNPENKKVCDLGNKYSNR